LQALIGKYESFIFVDFVPTSENLTYWLFNLTSTENDGTCLMLK